MPRRLLTLLLATSALALAAAGSSGASPATIVVSNHLTGEACAHPDAHTIQGGIALASPGDTIVVCEGTYHEGVRVDKRNLTIRAHMPLQTFVVGPGATGPSKQDGFTVLADGVTIEGFDISGFTTASGNGGDGVLVGFDDAGSGQHVSVTGAVIQDNYVHDNNDGIDILDTSGHRVLRNRVDDNANNGNFKGGGIVICADPGYPAQNNVVDRNEVSGNDGIGIYAGSCTESGDDIQGTVIRDNVVTHNNLHPQGNGVIALDVCCASGTSSNPVLVLGNNVHDNAHDGIGVNFHALYVIARGNVADRNDGDGFFVSQTTNDRFTRDSAHSNSGTDMYWDGAGAMTFKKNHCGTAAPSKAAWHCS